MVHPYKQLLVSVVYICGCHVCVCTSAAVATLKLVIHYNGPHCCLDALQDLIVTKAELASAHSEGCRYKEQCDELKSQNSTLASDMKHSRQSLTSAQVQW